jgi:hypothetical protein
MKHRYIIALAALITTSTTNAKDLANILHKPSQNEIISNTTYSQLHTRGETTEDESTTPFKTKTNSLREEILYGYSDTTTLGIALATGNYETKLNSRIIEQGEGFNDPSFLINYRFTNETDHSYIGDLKIGITPETIDAELGGTTTKGTTALGGHGIDIETSLGQILNKTTYKLFAGLEYLGKRKVTDLEDNLVAKHKSRTDYILGFQAQHEMNKYFNFNIGYTKT